MSVGGPIIDVTVSSIRQLTPRVREYILKSADGTALPPYAPGAHIELHTESPVSGPIVRHYSLVGGTGLEDDSADRYRIAVQREDHHRGSAHIHDSFDVGTPLRISRPKNNFLLDRRDRRSLLIAGGIGITPIYAMLRSLVRRRRNFEIVYAGRAPGQLAYADDIAALAGPSGQLHFSDGGAGRLDLAALLARQSDDTTVYVCGPGAMIEATHAAAVMLGWPTDRIRSECFGAGPSADARPFDVELRRTGRIVHVGRDTSILDALNAQGLDLLSDCRRGECGLCPLPVIEGAIDHRDRYLSDAEHAAGDTLCICVSRARDDRLVLDA